MVALSDRQPAKVIGPDAMLKDRPGFEVDLITRGSLGDSAYSVDAHEVLMGMKGHWRITWDGGTTVLAPGDTMAVPPGLERRIEPAMTGHASLYRVRSTEDPAGPTMVQS